jgi:glycine/D-amino acid oxidase-like deaminating enzyme
VKRTDVAIVGGGLAGTTIAYFLAREGCDVTLVEQHDLGTLASGSNAGSLHVQIPFEPFLAEGEAWAKAFAPVIPLLLRSIEMWKELSADVGHDFEAETPGALMVAESDEQMRHLERKARIERDAGLDIELLDRAALRMMAPYLSDRLVGANFCAVEGKANPLGASNVFGAAAERLGARVMRSTSVNRIMIEPGGFTLDTSAGTLAATRVVNCAGADAARIAAMVGLDLAIEGFPIQVNVTEPVAPLVKHLIYSAGVRLTLKQTRLGAFLIGGGYAARRDPHSGRAAVDLASLRANLAAAVATVPALAAVNVVRTWPAIVNGTADWRPILGEAPGTRGFYCCLFPWLGFTAAPYASRLVADAVLGRPPPKALAQFFL